MEATLNNQILERESASIGVEIEPEPTYLISKDTNNRIEMDPTTGDVQAASGGTLGCRSWAGKKGPSPSKNLSHPAIIDWALCEYLVFAATDTSGRTGLDKPFNPEVGLNILKSAANKMDSVRLLNMFQNVIASSIGSIRYNFATEPGKPDQPVILQHYNRVFIMRDGTPNSVHLNAAVARKLTPVQIKNRTKNNERMYQHDPLASDILLANGVSTDKLPEYYEANITKLTNIEDDWFMFIENRALQFIPDEEVKFILDNLDYGKYLFLLGNSFEKSWRNILPNAEPKTDMVPFTKDLDAAMAAFKTGVKLDLNKNANNKKTAANQSQNQITPTQHVIRPADDTQPAENELPAANAQPDKNIPPEEPAASTKTAESAPFDQTDNPSELPWEEDGESESGDTQASQIQSSPHEPEQTGKCTMTHQVSDLKDQLVQLSMFPDDSEEKQAAKRLISHQIGSLKDQLMQIKTVIEQTQWDYPTASWSDITEVYSDIQSAIEKLQNGLETL